MIKIVDALNDLKISEYVLRGEPQNESEFNKMFRKINGVNSYGISIEIDDPSDWGITWEDVLNKKTELENAEPMRVLREERNRKLQETDWWCCSDQKPNKAQLDYRTALRNLPETASPNLDENGNLQNVTWPKKPN